MATKHVAANLNDAPIVHRIQVDPAEIRKEWSLAAYSATYLNPALPSDARFDSYRFARGGGLS